MDRIQTIRRLSISDQQLIQDEWDIFNGVESLRQFFVMTSNLVIRGWLW